VAVILLRIPRTGSQALIFVASSQIGILASKVSSYKEYILLYGPRGRVLAPDIFNPQSMIDIPVLMTYKFQFPLIQVLPGY
jgi:hypothetical protein